jgi:hypothetical protein
MNFVLGQPASFEIFVPCQWHQIQGLFRDSFSRYKLSLLNKCYSLDWYSYTKRIFDGPLAMKEYLGRYTHRISISNNRIISVDVDTVTFGVRDYKNDNTKKNITLTKVEFIRRFLMHVLPKGFVKIRHYGLLANRNKKRN